MCIPTVLWRVRIVVFSPKPRKHGVRYPAITLPTGCLRVGLRLTILTFTLLLLAGDVEQNPGPGTRYRRTNKPNAMQTHLSAKNVTGEFLTSERDDDDDTSILGEVSATLKSIQSQITSLDSKLERFAGEYDKKIQVLKDENSELKDKICF